MKITFILPGIAKKHGYKYLKGWKHEPLTIAILKSLTPPDIETEFYDDRIELIDYETDADLIAITSDTYTSKRAYTIAGSFKDRGIPVVMGGFHATLMTEEALHHVDYVIKGNAEGVWETFLSDFHRGNTLQVYESGDAGAFVFPDRTIYKEKTKHYSPISLVETGRGCVNNCDFCAVQSYYGSRYHTRKVEDVVEDVKSCDRRRFLFVDDNIVANPRYALDLFKSLAPLKIKWFSQASLSIAKNPELLKWAKQSGCEVLLIGFESIDEGSLNSIGKGWMNRLGDIEELIHRIHRAGINIYANYVFGFDNDNRSTFDKTLEFALRQDFFASSFNHLLPYPNTALYNRLKSEGRLIYDRWWLEDGYQYGDIPFFPKNMSPEELSDECDRIRYGYHRFRYIAGRGISILKRKPSPALYLIYWLISANFKKEISGRRGLELAKCLDELPK
jgi:radical SAM superfamily enzyme YgiQ (UPF0313 family)